MNCNQLNDLCKKDNCNHPKIIFVTDPNAETGLRAFGGRYNDETQVIQLVVGSTQQIQLPSTMPNRRTSYSGNTIQINEAGVYEINYFMNASVEVGALVTLAVRKNGENIESTVIERLLEADTGNFYTGSTIVELQSGDEIDMAISALVAVGVTLGTGVNATLSVKKLN